MYEKIFDYLYNIDLYFVGVIIIEFSFFVDSISFYDVFVGRIFGED